MDSIKFRKSLRYSPKGYRRLSVRDDRVVYRMETESTIVICGAVKHRKNIYEDL